MSVGIDRLNVRNCYQNWIHAALPCALPHAFRLWYSDTDAPEDPEKETQKWATSRLAKAGAVMNKSQLQSIIEDSWRDWDGLTASLKEAREMKLTAGAAPGACTVDIGFVVDSTGSMAPYMNTVKASVKAIVHGDEGIITRVQNETGMEIKLRTAFLGFRDHSDGDAQFKDELLFTDDVVGEFVPFVNSLKPEGGGDLVEDVIGAFDRVSKWKWTSRIKCLIFIGDSPGHTNELHDYENKDPEYWNEHKNHLSPATVMQALAKEDIGLFFCRINAEATKKMEYRLRQLYEDPVHNKKSRTFEGLDLVQIPPERNPFTNPASANHLVFVMDESGSMGGNPWNECVRSYQHALQSRISGLSISGSQVLKIM